jgi:hypothetical protein
MAGFGWLAERRQKALELRRMKARMSLVRGLAGSGVMPGRGADVEFVLGLVDSLIEAMEREAVAGGPASVSAEAVLVALDQIETTVKYLRGEQLRGF